MCRGVLVLVFVEHYSRILMASASGMFWWRKTSAGGSSPTARPLLSTAWNSMCTYAQCIVHDHFYHKLAIVVCARMRSAQFHFYQQRAKVHVRSSTACACSANVRVCTHTSTHASTWGFYVFAVWPCSPPCLGTTANSLRGVNFEQTQTSRKTISNHSSKPGILT